MKRKAIPLAARLMGKSAMTVSRPVAVALEDDGRCVGLERGVTLLHVDSTTPRNRGSSCPEPWTNGRISASFDRSRWTGLSSGLADGRGPSDAPCGREESNSQAKPARWGAQTRL